MEVELRNLKGTKDFMPDEQKLRNKIKNTLEEVFKNYGFKPLETPILYYFDILASKYAGGAEILKEIYTLVDQGERDIALRYDLTVPFAKVIGMNPELRMPFKRYEIGKVFRNGPVKTGRMREFIQCDVDMVGVTSMMAEAEFLSLAVDAFEKLKLDIYISFNNRKLLTGILAGINIDEDNINDVILTLDKIEKIGENGVCDELTAKGFDKEIIKNLFEIINSPERYSISFYKERFNNDFAIEGIKELEELNLLIEELGIGPKLRFNPFLARGLDIYTGTVYEIFLSDGCITSSLGGGGRYDKIIGGFLNNGNNYPAIGISFGLDVIYSALCTKQADSYIPNTSLYIIPLGTSKEAAKIAYELRQNGIPVDIEMTDRKLKKSLDYANKERIPFTFILGEDELKKGEVKIKNMYEGKETTVLLANLKDEVIQLISQLQPKK